MRTRMRLGGEIRRAVVILQFLRSPSTASIQLSMCRAPCKKNNKSPPDGRISWRPRPESNRDLELRRLSSYPLNDGDTIIAMAHGFPNGQASGKAAAMWGMIYVLCLMPALAWAQLQPQLQPFGTLNATVTHITDGDTLRLSTGLTVRLLDINTPELAHDGRAAEPLARQATQALAKLALGQPVQVQLGARVYDPYNRVLGQVFLRNGSRQAWVNGGLVRGGFAHVYTFPDNRMYGRELQALEAAARAQKLGLWALPRWQIRPAASCCAEADIGRFVLVQGTVQSVATVGNRVYLNFGPDWRTDFSVVIDQKHEKFFRPRPAKTEHKKAKKGEKRARKPVFNWNDYLGKTVLVRGMAQPVNGILIRATHPEQLQVLP